MKFIGTMLGSEDPASLAKFYTNILGKPGFHEGEWYGWRDTSQFMIGAHSEVHGKNKNPERIILTIESHDVQGDFNKLTKLGADVVAKPYKPSENQDMWLATITDPDGNYLQLATPWK
jgi:predicted enzyme related to lactoylglutathione lyase